LPDVLLFLLNILEFLPNLDNSTSSLGEKYAAVLIECLTSSKSETRAAASQLLNASVEKNVVGMESIRKATERLKPAKQRSVGSQITKLQKLASENKGKENDEPRSDDLSTQQCTDSSVSPRRPLPAKQPPTEAEKSHQEVPSQLPLRKERKSPEGLPRHPLESLSVTHALRTHERSVVGWPEYPEEPQGSSLLGSLKKCWSPFLPPVTVATLFPSSGIRKQDDAQQGCDLLSSAVDLDRSSGGDATETQLDFILKWLVFVLCSNESTVGLQVLIPVIKDLLLLLREKSRQLSDSEALEFVPFLLDKASVTKVKSPLDHV